MKIKKTASLVLTAFIVMAVFNMPEARGLIKRVDRQEPAIQSMYFNLIDWNPYNYKSEDLINYYETTKTGYRYGPAIMVNQDGSYEMWMSSPGNNKDQWDWIRHSYSKDGYEWADEKIVLKPTPSSKDKNSVCDPGVIYFDGYYYMAFTATADEAQKGYNNSAFVARSKDPQGPFEKWNGQGWGGDPEPIIEYSGEEGNWGIGEVSLLIVDGKIHIYYSYSTLSKYEEHLALAETVENWPETIKLKGPVLSKGTQDSLDVTYDEYLNEYIAFAIKDRMSQTSQIGVYASDDGTEFKEVAVIDCEENAHNIGVAKDINGHINSKNGFLVGYAYGEKWGSWSLKLSKITIQ